jgi:predicted nucleic acid-binding protein
MNDEGPKCSHVCDCAALLEIAKTQSNNLRSLYLDQLQKGVIAVPACVLGEFRKLYEDEAIQIERSIKTVIQLRQKEYFVAVARITDRKGSGFARRPYDGDTDLYTAAIAWVEGYTALTTGGQASAYTGMECEVSELSTWVESLGITPKIG